MHKKEVDVLLIALSSPILIGIYENEELIETIESQEKSSEVLPLIYETIFNKYSVKNLLYVNGPGSFMAIKVAYIFLKSLSVLKQIPLFATDVFKFNKNSPIKAIGKLYFVKVSSEIKTQKFDEVPQGVIELPKKLHYEDFSTNAAPLYVIGAV
jgi:tRNA A37 threonylcarbamoyladenosine modification protein TsaB